MNDDDCILDETCGIFPIRMRKAPLHPEINYMDLDLAKTAIENAYETTIAYFEQLNKSSYTVLRSDMQTIKSAKKVKPQYGSSAFDSNHISNFPFSDTGALNIIPECIGGGVKITGPGIIMVNTDDNNFVMYLHDDELKYVPEVIVDEFGLKIEEVNDDWSIQHGVKYKVTQPDQKGGWSICDELTFATKMFASIYTLEYDKLVMPEFLATQVGKTAFNEFSKLMMPTKTQVEKGY